MMKPVAAEINHGVYILIQKCQKCGLQKKNKTAAEDNFEALLKLS